MARHEVVTETWFVIASDAQAAYRELINWLARGGVTHTDSIYPNLSDAQDRTSNRYSWAYGDPIHKVSIKVETVPD